MHGSAIGVHGNAWEHSGSAIGINGNAWEHSGSPWDSMPRGIHRDMSEIRSRPGQWGSQAQCTGLGITPQCAVARGAQAHAFEGLIERNPPSHTLSPSARLPPRYGM